MTQTVREFSPVGPCIEIGTFVKRTAKTITFVDSHGDTGRRGGWRVAARDDGSRSYIHIDPCPSCPDHSNTQYPHGYMD